MAEKAKYMLLPDESFLEGVARQYEDHAIRPGDLVGALRVESVLGHQGNVSTVYRSRALSDDPSRNLLKNKVYIVKGIPQKESHSQSTNTRNLRSFFNEMRILPHIRNPARNNIVEMVDCNDDPSAGKLFMAFKEIAYQAVREKYPNKQIEPTVILGIARDLNRALMHLHGLGIAHGDVKPENFMMDFGSVPILVDFGSSFFYGRKGKGGRLFPCDPTGYREAFTPLYTPPEVAKFKLYELGQNPKTHKADSWALGLTLGELLSGERPYHWLEDFSLQNLLETIGRGECPIQLDVLQDLARKAPRKPIRDTIIFLANLIQRFLEPAVEKRLSCANAFGEILQFADHIGVLRPPEKIKGFRGKVEMARKLADLDGGGDESGTGRRRRRRSAKLELEAYELQQAYLKEKTRSKTIIQKGWTPGFEKVAPPSEEPQAKSFKSFEEFVQEKAPPKDEKKNISFDEFRQHRESKSLERMKDLFAGLEGSDTKQSAGTDARGGTGSGGTRGHGDKTAPLAGGSSAPPGSETVTEADLYGSGHPKSPGETAPSAPRDTRPIAGRSAAPDSKPGISGDETLPGPNPTDETQTSPFMPVDQDAPTAKHPIRDPSLEETVFEAPPSKKKVRPAPPRRPPRKPPPED
jgi:serine/threonine protein kinase